MKTQNQIWADKIFGKIITFFLNIVVRITGWILRPDHSLDKSFKVIAVCKYKGMGSIIQSTPLLQTIKKYYPECRIVYVSTEANRTILEKIDIIDDLILINDKGLFKLFCSIISAIIKMWRYKIEVFFDLEIYSHFSSIITTLSLARNRLGFYLRSGNYRLGIYTHMMFYNIKSPVSLTYLQMARLLGCNEPVTDLFPLVPNNDIPVNEIPATPYIVININASDLRIERRWPASYFSGLIERITENDNRKIILIGNRIEKPYVENFYNSLKQKEQIVNLAGKTSLNSLLSILKNADLLITNDTGPMHLAFALRCKVIALFGPCSPSQYGYHKNTGIVYKNIYCSPCVHEFDRPPCKGENICMKSISVNDVYQVFLTFNESDPVSSHKNNQPIIYAIDKEAFIPGMITR